MENAIEIKNLCKNYPSFKLDNVSLSLPKGYIMGFVGPNGAGKSTTISILLGLAKADGGSALIDGCSAGRMTAAQKEDVGAVLDECCFPETLNYIQVNKFMSKIYKKWDSEKFMSSCRRFSLPEKEVISKYSKGMKMKLSIAAAISHGAKLLVLDEATSGLDPVVREEILDMLLEFVQDENNSVFISSHIISDLEKVCDYITFINDGKIVLSGEKEAITRRYGILRCSNEDFAGIDKSAVISFRQNTFATDALVLRDKITGGHIVDKAGIEDIMLYYAKEKK